MSKVLDPEEISFESPVSPSAIDPSEVSFEPVHAVKPHGPYIKADTVPPSPILSGERGQPPARSPYNPVGQRGQPGRDPVPIPAEPPSDESKSLIDPLLDVLAPLGKVPLAGMPLMMRKGLDTPEGQALADTVRGLATKENLGIIAGLAGANALPGLGTAVDIAAAGYFGHQMMESGIAAEADMQAAQEAARRARARGDETAAKAFDDKARYARAQKYISSTFLVLIGKAGTEKASESATEHITETPRLSPEEVQARVKADLEPRVHETADVSFEAPEGAATHEPAEVAFSPTAPEDINAEIARLKAENEKLQQHPFWVAANRDRTAGVPATESTPPGPPPTPELTPQEQPATQEVAPELIDNERRLAEQERERRAALATEPEKTFKQLGETKSPESEAVAPIPETEPPKDETKPKPTLSSYFEDKAIVDNHPVWRYGDAKDPFKGFHETLANSFRKAPANVVEDYVDKLRAMGETHVPEILPDVNKAQAAIDSGTAEEFATAAEDARQKMSTDWHEKSAASNEAARAKMQGETAEPSPDRLIHQGADTEFERFAQEFNPDKQSLVEFLRKKGGLKDEAGELASREVDKNKIRNSKGNLIQSKTGLGLDPAVEAAIEEGYLPAGSSINDLLDKIDEEVRGKKVYSPSHEGRALSEEPALEGVTMQPSQAKNALKTRKGPYFKDLRDAFHEHYDRENRDAIEEHLAKGEEQPEPKSLQDLHDQLAAKQEESRTQALSELAAGRRPEQLKEGKVFDETRLVDSELFGGKGGPQAGMFDDEDASFNFGASAVEKLDQVIEDAKQRIADRGGKGKGGTEAGHSPLLDDINDLITIGAAHIARGVVKFADWAVSIAKSFPDKFKGMDEAGLRDIYAKAMARVQAVRDAGVDIGGRMGQALIHGSLGTEGKYVKNESFTFNFGKNDPTTATNLIKEYSGRVGEWTLRVRHLADDIRRSIPDKLTRAGMFWYKAARGDLGMIHEAIADGRFREYKTELEKALNLSGKAKAELEKVGQYYAESGKVSRENGVIREVRDNYMKRIYAPEKPQDYVKTGAGSTVNPFTSSNKHRVYATEFDAVRGIHEDGSAGKPMKFAVRDIADALELHGRAMARTNISRLMMDAMTDQTIGGWVKPKDIPNGWVRVGEFEKNIPIKDADGKAVIGSDGNQIIDHRVFAAPEGIAQGKNHFLSQGLKPITEAGKPPGILAKYQGLIKTADLSSPPSVFHHLALSLQTIYGAVTNPISAGKTIYALITGVTKAMNEPSFRAIALDHARHLGKTHQLQTNMDITRTLVASDPTFFGKVTNAPGVKQMLAMTDRSANFLFGKVQTFLKVQKYAADVSQWMSKHPDATPAQVKAAKQGFALTGNSVYGGLNWETMGITKADLRVLRGLMLAPDWGISNGKLVTQGFKGGTEGLAARKYWIGAYIAGQVLNQGVSMLLNGHTTYDNPKGHQNEVEIAPHVYVNFNRGPIGDLQKFGSMVDQNGPIKGSMQFAASKLAPVPRTILGWGSGVQYSGRPITQGKESRTDKSMDYLKFAGRNLAPVPFGVSNVGEYLANEPQKTTAGAIAVATGVGRYAPVKQGTRRPGRRR